MHGRFQEQTAGSSEAKDMSFLGQERPFAPSGRGTLSEYDVVSRNVRYQDANTRAENLS